MLTGVEEKVLLFTARHLARNGRAPTLAEIGKAVGIRSRGTVHRYVQSLVRKGCLKRTGRGWRGIALAGAYQRGLVALPLLGRVTPADSVKHLADREVNFSALLLGPDRFALEVAGDSMADAGIVNGDIVILRRASDAQNGDIVCAVIDGEQWTLRRLRKHGERVELTPANRSLASMVYPAKRVQIQGVAVAQVRIF
jgi:repressor LexA